MKTVEEWIQNYLEKEFEITEIDENMELINDLELRSLEIFTLLADMECEFGIEIPEKLIRQMVTVQDVERIIEGLIEHE